MAESKISCPKCCGHIVFPKELAGQEIACPHCSESILLPKSKFSTAWIIAVVFAFITVCLASILVLELQKKRETPPIRSPEIVSSPTKISQDEPTKQMNGQLENSEDGEAIKNLCREFYNGLNNQDANALYNLLATSCQKALSIEDMKKLSDGNAKYEFIGLDLVKYQSSPLGMSAMAKVKRSVQDSHSGTQEGWRNLKFLKEPKGWRLFRDEDLMDKIVRQFTTTGFSDEVNANIQLLRDGDPFDVWDKNNTNAFKTVFKLSQREAGVFPWDVEFLVESNNVDGYTLNLNYRVRNKSENT
jgi:hypothetical protein